RLEESRGPIGHGDVASARMEAAQSSHHGTVPVAVPSTNPTVGNIRIWGEHGVAQAVAQKALVPACAQKTLIGLPVVATILSGRRRGGGTTVQATHEHREGGAGPRGGVRNRWP